MPDSTLRSFTAHDGSNLAVMDWPLPSGVGKSGSLGLRRACVGA